MNRNKFEGIMHLLDDAKNRLEESKSNHKTLVNAEENFKQYLKKNFHLMLVGDRLLELVQDYISYAQDIVYLIGVENGVCLQRNPKAAAEEDIIKNYMPRVEVARKTHKWYIEAENALNEFISKEFASVAGTPMSYVYELIKLIQKYANHMQEVTYIIGIEDGMKLYKSLESGTFAIGVIEEIYKFVADEKEAAQLPS